MFEKKEGFGAKVDKYFDEHRTKQKTKEKADMEEIFQFGEKHPVLAILLFCWVGVIFLFAFPPGAFAFFLIAGYFLVKYIRKLIKPH